MQISNERYEFLLYVLFGCEKDPYISSSKTAYRDLCRTLRFGAMGGEVFRKQVDSILKVRVSNILNHKCLNQSVFDEWHQSACNELVTYYSSLGVIFTIGHAQKWINMMMKYLYSWVCEHYECVTVSACTSGSIHISSCSARISDCSTLLCLEQTR